MTGDFLQMSQLFQNLIGNSIKYRKPDTRPEVHISVQSSGEDWVIAIGDNGIGFESQYAERIFGLFQRLHGSGFAGTGVGLAICRRIVELHGGRIWAVAAPGEGAVFSFSIPVSRQSGRRRIRMEPGAGIEPATSSLQNWRSTN